jgi:hypothetical protein
MLGIFVDQNQYSSRIGVCFFGKVQFNVAACCSVRQWVLQLKMFFSVGEITTNLEIGMNSRCAQFVLQRVPQFW